MLISKSLLVMTAILASSCYAFTAPSSRSVTLQNGYREPNLLLFSLVSSDSNPSDEMIRKDIEVLREEARQRLQVLNTEMEELLEKHHQHKTEVGSSTFLDASSFEKVDLPLVTHSSGVEEYSVDGKKKVISVQNVSKKSTKEEKKTSLQLVQPPPSYHADCKLLHDTRWKVVIKVGSAGQNAAVEGVEKALLLHLVVDFSPEPLKESDDLLQGTANAKVLKVKEGWIGASSWTDGRQRNVQINSTGGWKILPGQGPKGIDILRFYIDIEEEICHDKDRSTLRCPATRVYCTSGIFSMDHHNESEKFKDYLRAELEKLVHKYDDLTLEEELDERLFSLEGLKRGKQMMDLQSQIKATNKQILQARIRDPEKAMLRLSRRRDVGVTKEGQVCYREIKGLSPEYLVLGKMEMASVDRPIIEPDDTNKLRP